MYAILHSAFTIETLNCRLSVEPHHPVTTTVQDLIIWNDYLCLNKISISLTLSTAVSFILDPGLSYIITS